MVKTILCIGQSDSCAGTGIQADLKTAHSLGVYAATITTTITVQNTAGIIDNFVVPDDLVEKQIQAVVDDIKPAFIKIGALGNEAVINRIGDYLDEMSTKQKMIVIVDPVMSRTGTSLLDKPGRDALKRRLLIHANVLLPNMQEAFELSGIDINDIEQLEHAASTLRTLGVEKVIIKGTKLFPDKIVDILATEDHTEIFEYERMETEALYGAGATLATALTSYMAKGSSVKDAYTKARDYVIHAMNASVPIGEGFIPLYQKPPIE